MANTDYSEQELEMDPELRAQAYAMRKGAALAPAPAVMPNAPAPKPDPLADLSAQDDAAREQKSRIMALGGIGDNLANRQSFGNFFLKEMNPKQDVSGAMKAQADLVEDPLAKQKKLLEAYQSQKSADFTKKSTDKDSDISKLSAQINAVHLQKVKSALKTPEAQAMVDRVVSQLPNMSEYEQDQLMDKTGMSKLLGSDANSSDKVAQALALLASRQGNQENMLDQRIHDKVVARLNNDKQLQSRLVQYQNLGNALTNFASAEHTTPQQLDELQQSIRANLGIKGGSGVGEREHTYINSLGLNADRLKQFITGNPTDIAKNAPLLKHLQDLAKLEQGNIRGQYESRMKSVTAGHDSLYKRRPELRSDLDDLIQSNLAQIGGGQSIGSEGAPTGGGGLIPSANAAGGAPEQKVINGAVYEKTAGGWKKVQ